MPPNNHRAVYLQNYGDSITVYNAIEPVHDQNDGELNATDDQLDLTNQSNLSQYDTAIQNETILQGEQNLQNSNSSCQRRKRNRVENNYVDDNEEQQQELNPSLNSTFNLEEDQSNPNQSPQTSSQPHVVSPQNLTTQNSPNPQQSSSSQMTNEERERIKLKARRKKPVDGNAVVRLLDTLPPRPGPYCGRLSNNQQPSYCPQNQEVDCCILLNEYLQTMSQMVQMVSLLNPNLELSNLSIEMNNTNNDSQNNSTRVSQYQSLRENTNGDDFDDVIEGLKSQIIERTERMSSVNLPQRPSLSRTKNVKKVTNQCNAKKPKFSDTTCNVM